MSDILHCASRRTLPPILVIAVSAVMFVGCGAGQDAPGFVARDSVGIRIVENGTPLNGQAPMCELGKAPLATIGRDPTGSEYELYRVSSAGFTHDGGVAIVNRGTHSIRLYSRDGVFRRSIGRAGKGPGEFTDPIELASLSSDSLAVLDWDLMRISVLTADGALARTAPLTPALLNPTGDMATLAADEPFLLAFESIPTTIGPEMREHRLLIVRFDRAGLLADTVATLPYGRRALINPETRMIGSPVFVSRGNFAASGDHLYLTDGSTPEVRVLNGAGVLHQIIRWRPGNLTVEPTDVDAYWDQQMQEADAGFRRMLAQRRQVLPVAERFPAVSGLLADDTGSIWVQEYPRPAAGTQRWLRFSREGILQCVMLLAQNTAVLAVDADRLLIISRNDLDVEYLQILSHSMP